MSENNYFTALANINVNDKTEKKNNLTYLSWAWAWGDSVSARKRWRKASCSQREAEMKTPRYRVPGSGAFDQVTPVDQSADR